MTNPPNEQMLHGFALLTATITQDKSLFRTLIDKSTAENTTAGLVAAGVALAELAASQSGITASQLLAELTEMTTESPG